MNAPNNQVKLPNASTYEPSAENLPTDARDRVTPVTSCACCVAADERRALRLQRSTLPPIDGNHPELAHYLDDLDAWAEAWAIGESDFEAAYVLAKLRKARRDGDAEVIASCISEIADTLLAEVSHRVGHEPERDTPVARDLHLARGLFGTMWTLFDLVNAAMGARASAEVSK